MLCFFGLKALLSYFCGCKPWKMMSEATNNLPDSSLSADESLRQWWQTRFNAPLPDDVRTFVRQLVRQETLLARRAESHLDDATLIKVRQDKARQHRAGSRQCQGTAAAHTPLHTPEHRTRQGAETPLRGREASGHNTQSATRAGALRDFRGRQWPFPAHTHPYAYCRGAAAAQEQRQRGH